MAARNLGHPDAGPDAIAAIVPWELDSTGRSIEILKDHCRIIERTSEQDDAKFIPAKPTDDIAFAQITRQGPCHAPQQGIAGDMAGGIVDDFQPVEIHKGQGMLNAGVTAFRQRLFKLLLEG